MTNNLNEKRSDRLIIVAVAVTLIFSIIGLSVGMVFAIKLRVENKSETAVARYLLIDAADGLNEKTSALRLCRTEETAKELSREALVFAVRAETALECVGGDCYENRAKEAFLNDIASVLAQKNAKKCMEKSEDLYRFSAMFKAYAESGVPFEYNGELVEAASGEKSGQPDESKIEKSKAAVEKALGDMDLRFIGAFGDRIAFEIRGENGGYVETENGKIAEFSLGYTVGGESGDPRATALTCAEKCGYGDLEVYDVYESDGVYTVKMCCNSCGALCRDECAVAEVSGDRAIAFSSGKCGKHHKLPSPRVSESDAAKSAPGAIGKGVLVTTFDGERDRICYEYRYELEDGIHYVYVCAENGEQMSVR